MRKDIIKKVSIGLGLGLFVMMTLLFYGDIQKMKQLLSGFRWQFLPLILGLTLANYLLRGYRFHYYLRQIGLRRITYWTSLRVFIGGFSLSLTPGKLGELIRVVWLKNLAGADPARVTPPIFVDRVVDGLAMAMLAALGLLAFPQYWPFVVLMIMMMLAAIVVIQIRPLADWVLAFGEQLPLVAKVVHHLRALHESAYELLRPKNFLVGLVISFIALIIQGLAFFLILLGLGVPYSPNLGLLSIFTLATGALVGGASSLPGGLGAVEASMTGLLQSVLGLSVTTAATATLMIRFCTLWFGVMLGVLTVLIWHKMLFGPSATETTEAAIVAEL